MCLEDIIVNKFASQTKTLTITQSTTRTNKKTPFKNPYKKQRRSFAFNQPLVKGGFGSFAGGQLLCIINLMGEQVRCLVQIFCSINRVAGVANFGFISSVRTNFCSVHFLRGLSGLLFGTSFKRYCDHVIKGGLPFFCRGFFAGKNMVTDR